MSLYTRNQPMGTDPLDISQPFLTNNTNAADDAFGTDHYKFSDTTSSRGFHNQVTTPNFLASPSVLPNVKPTTTTNPIFYGFGQLDGAGIPTTALGVLQYSRGINNAVPTPLTSIQSAAGFFNIANNTSTPILDFKGITNAIAEMTIVSKQVTSTFYAVQKTIKVFFQNPSSLGPNSFFSFDPTAQGPTGVFLSQVGATTVLQLTNNFGSALDLCWVLRFYRIE